MDWDDENTNQEPYNLHTLQIKFNTSIFRKTFLDQLFQEPCSKWMKNRVWFRGGIDQVQMNLNTKLLLAS